MSTATISVEVPSWVAEWIEKTARKELRSTRKQAAAILIDHVKKAGFQPRPAKEGAK